MMDEWWSDSGQILTAYCIVFFFPCVLPVGWVKPKVKLFVPSDSEEGRILDASLVWAVDADQSRYLSVYFRLFFRAE